MNSRGELLFADVWNQRIRKISGYQRQCLYSANVNADIRIQYADRLTRLVTTCNSTTALDTLYTDIEQEVLGHRSTALMGSDFCEFAAMPDPGYMVNWTKNTLVLCTLCDELWPASQAGQRPAAICPARQMCDCRQATAEVTQMDVYRDCPPQSAYYDRWHRMISAFIQCWINNPEDAVWLQNLTQKALLKDHLLAYNNLSITV